jgi:hypothetical protein
MEESARAAPALFGGVSYARLDGDGLQWPCPDRAHPGTPRLHERGFARGRAELACVAFEPSPESDVDGFPYALGTGRVLQQYNVGTQTRRTSYQALAALDWLEIHPDDAAREGIGAGRGGLDREPLGAAARAPASRSAFDRGRSSSRSTSPRRTQIAWSVRRAIRAPTVPSTSSRPCA